MQAKGAPARPKEGLRARRRARPTSSAKKARSMPSLLDILL
jgi:hypothetical protein